LWELGVQKKSTGVGVLESPPSERWAPREKKPIVTTKG